MKRILPVHHLFCLCRSPPAQEKPEPPEEKAGDKAPRLSFEAALERMFSANEALKAAENEENDLKYERYAALGLYFPQVGLSANALKMSDPVVMDLNDIRTAIQAVTSHGTPVEQYAQSQLPEFKKTVAEEELLKVDATIKGPLFTGGKITAANRAAKARMSESSSKMRDLKNRLITELATRYFGLRLYGKVVEVRAMVLEGMQKHLDDSRALQKNGMIPMVELLHAEVAFAGGLARTEEG
jgi:outer membrane protein TolC